MIHIYRPAAKTIMGLALVGMWAARPLFAQDPHPWPLDQFREQAAERGFKQIEGVTVPREFKGPSIRAPGGIGDPRHGDYGWSIWKPGGAGLGGPGGRYDRIYRPPSFGGEFGGGFRR